jgi:hypothetical protein
VLPCHHTALDAFGSRDPMGTPQLISRRRAEQIPISDFTVSCSSYPLPTNVLHVETAKYNLMSPSVRHCSISWSRSRSPATRWCPVSPCPVLCWICWSATETARPDAEAFTYVCPCDSNKTPHRRTSRRPSALALRDPRRPLLTRRPSPAGRWMASAD